MSAEAMEGGSPMGVGGWDKAAEDPGVLPEPLYPLGTPHIKWNLCTNYVRVAWPVIGSTTDLL